MEDSDGNAATKRYGFDSTSTPPADHVNVERVVAASGPLTGTFNVGSCKGMNSIELQTWLEISAFGKNIICQF